MGRFRSVTGQAATCEAALAPQWALEGELLLSALKTEPFQWDKENMRDRGMS